MRNVSSNVIQTGQRARRLAISLIVSALAFTTSAAGAADVPQSFTLDGRLFSDTAATVPLVDPSIQFKLQILDEAKICILYEESQAYSTLASKGYFSIQVGTVTGNVARTGTDSGNSMSTIFQNINNINGKKVADGNPCTVTAAGGKRRYVRITIAPSTLGGAERLLSPDINVDSVPNAVVAERAESLQGYRSTEFLKVNTTAGSVLSQTNLENLFTNTTRFNALSTMVDGTSSSYMRSNSAAGAQLPVITGAPTAPSAGSLWYDSTDSKVKFQTAGGPVTVGTATGNGLLSDLGAATGGNTIDNLNYAQVWNWSTATTEVPWSISANSMTTGTLFDLTTSSASLNSTNGLFRVANTGAATTGIVARIQANATAGSGLTVLANGNVGVGTSAPTSAVHVIGTTGSIAANVAGAPPSISLRHASNTNGSWGIYQGNSGTYDELSFMTGGSVTRMTMLFNGNVGIGTTAPGSALDVKGTLRLSGATSGYVGFAPAAAAGSTTYTLPSADGSTGEVLTTNGAGTLTWAAPAGSGSLSSTLADGKLFIGSAANVATAQTAGGDVSVINDGTFTVNKIKNVTVSAAAPTDGQILKYVNGTTSWTPSNFSIGDLLTAAGAQQFAGSSACTAKQTSTWSSLTDTFTCTDIAGLDAAVITTGTIAAARLPTSATVWTESSGDIYRTTGNVGIGTTAPATALDLNGAWSVRGMAAPAASVATQGRIYFDSTANKFKVSENNGAYVDLVTAGGSVSGLTTTYLPKATSATTLGDSVIAESSGKIGIGSATPTAKVDVVGDNSAVANAPLAFNVLGGTSTFGGGRGGNINMTAGNGNYGGNVTLAGGGGSASAGAASLSLVGGLWGGGGGGTTLSGGSGGNGDPGGTVSLVGGSVSSATGGAISLTGATSGGGNNDGGTVTIQGGAKMGTGTDGDVLLATTRGKVGIGTTAPATALDLNGAWSVRGMAAPAVSVAGQGRMYFDSTSNTFKVSQNNGAYVDLATGGGAISGLTTGQLPKATSATTVGDSIITEAASKISIGTTSPVGTLTVNTASGTTGLSVTNASNLEVFKVRTNANYGILELADSGGTTRVSMNSYNANGALIMSDGSGSNKPDGAVNSFGSALWLGSPHVTGQENGIFFSTGGNLAGAAITYYNANNSGWANGGLKLKTTSAGTVATRMTIDPSGNIGIGTTVPGTTLDLNGAWSVRGMAAPAASVATQGRIYFDSTANKFKVSENNGAYVDLVTGGGSISGLTTGTIPKATSATTVGDSVIRESSGKIGVGTGTHIDYLLDVRANSANEQAFFGNDSELGLRLGATTGSTFAMIQATAVHANDSVPLAINPWGGNVGVGTTAPSGKLHVIGINSGTGSSSAANALTVVGGSGGTTGGNGGGVSITGGTATQYTAGLGGSVAISGGVGQYGGTVTLSSGNTYGTGSGSNVTLGSAGGGTGNGALLSLTAGNGGNGSGDGGTLSLTGGAGAGGGGSTPGGPINLTGGAGNGAAGTGANVVINGGAKAGTGIDGNVLLATTRGYVGIGTTAPATALDLNGAWSVRGMAAPAASVATQGRIYFDSTANKFKVSENNGAYVDLVSAGGGISGLTTSYLPKATSATALGDSVIAESSGKIGIGTATPSAALHVIGPNGSGAAAPAAMTVLAGNGASGYAGGGISLTGGNGTGGPVGGTVSLLAGGSTNGGNQGLGGALTLNGGNGAGPGGAVTLSGGEAGNGSASGSVNINGGTNTGATSGAGAGGAVNISGGAAGSGNTNGGSIVINPGAKAGTGTDGNILLGSVRGYVGIGTTAPATALDLNGAWSVRGMAAPATSVATQGRIYFDSTANKFKVSENNGAYVDLVSAGGGISGLTSGQIPKATSATSVGDSIITESSGKIGIGTTSPDASAKLSIPGTGTMFSLAMPNADAGGNTWFLASSANAWSSGGGKLLITRSTTASAAAMAIDTSGNVGIATTNPTAKLDIAGQARTTNSSGAANINGSAAVNWNNGNAQSMSVDCATTAFTNMLDAGTYILAVTETGTSTCTFSQAGLTFYFSPANGPRTTAKRTVYTFQRIGTDVYVSWIPGFQ